MKQLTVVVIFILCLVEIIFLYEYFSVFNGAISSDIQNWSLFSDIINGFVVALLTSLNIWVFYKISTYIENNNKERRVAQTIFEAQKIVAGMRIRQYEELVSIANRFKVSVYKGQEDPQLYEQLKRQLMSMNDSWLYKADNIKDPSILHYNIEKFLENDRTKSKEDKIDQLSNIMIIIEHYIIMQLLRDKDVEGFISSKKNNGYLDSTIACFIDLSQMTVDMMKKDGSIGSKQES